jgi:hypothetical protein
MLCNQANIYENKDTASRRVGVDKNVFELRTKTEPTLRIFTVHLKRVELARILSDWIILFYKDHTGYDSM